MRPGPDVDPGALHAARLKAGLTQHELARRIGVAGGERISKWELGTSSPRPRMLQLLADALGVPPAELLTRVDEDGLDLRRLRVSAGLSAREVAARAHMSLPTLVRWESGRIARVPSRAALRPLASALGVSVKDVERALACSRHKRATQT